MKNHFIGTVLLSVDDRGLRMGLAGSLAAHGFSLVMVNDKIEGAQLVLDNVIDAVVAEVKLPDGEGMEIIEVAKRKCSDIPIFIVSGERGMWDLVMDQIIDAVVFWQPIDCESVATAVEGALPKNMPRVTSCG